MRQAVDAQLCRAIIGLADISDHPGRRREQCIGSILLLAEKLDRSPADVERTMKMDVNNGFPVFDLHLVEHRVTQDSGGIDHRVKTADRRQRSIAHAVRTSTRLDSSR